MCSFASRFVYRSTKTLFLERSCGVVFLVMCCSICGGVLQCSGPHANELRGGWGRGRSSVLLNIRLGNLFVLFFVIVYCLFTLSEAGDTSYRPCINLDLITEVWLSPGGRRLATSFPPPPPLHSLARPSTREHFSHRVSERWLISAASKSRVDVMD